MMIANVKKWLSKSLCIISLIVFSACAIALTTDWFHHSNRAYWLYQHQPGANFIAGVLFHRQLCIGWIRDFNGDLDKLGEVRFFEFGLNYLGRYDIDRLITNNGAKRKSDSDIAIVTELHLDIRHLTFSEHLVSLLLRRSRMLRA